MQFLEGRFGRAELTARSCRGYFYSLSPFQSIHNAQFAEYLSKKPV